MEKEVIVISAGEASPVSEPEPERPSRLRVAAYCRVSTEQEEQLGSCENQVSYYRSYIEQNPEYELAGIYVDEGISGTNAKRRKAFQTMMENCRSGKIDLIITKSISRFARNTQDCLTYTRMLKERNIGVFFEKENIRTMDNTGELLFTILSSLAQEESRNISENTRWGIRSNFQRGIPHFKTHNLYGYGKADDGSLIIQNEQAAVIRRIYQSFLFGYSCHEIAKQLNKEEIPGPRHRPAWSSIAIRRILSNEQYNGDVLMQKYYNQDYIYKKTTRNTGQLPMYWIKDDHPAIIDKYTWTIAQQEKQRRDRYRQFFQVRLESDRDGNPLTGKVICSACKRPMLRKKVGSSVLWSCSEPGCICTISESSILLNLFIRLISYSVEKEHWRSTWSCVLQDNDSYQSYYCGRFLDSLSPSLEPDLLVLIRTSISHVLTFEQELQICFKWEPIEPEAAKAQ